MCDRIASEIRWYFRRVRQEQRRERLNQFMLSVLVLVTGVTALILTKEGGFLLFISFALVLLFNAKKA